MFVCVCMYVCLCTYIDLLKPFLFTYTVCSFHSEEELRRMVESWNNFKWCLFRWPRWSGRLWRVLWYEGVCSYSTKARRFCWFLSWLGRLQEWVWEFWGRVLAWTGQDSPSDEPGQKRTSCGSDRLGWKERSGFVQRIYCGWRRHQLQDEFWLICRR